MYEIFNVSQQHLALILKDPAFLFDFKNINSAF